MCPPVIAAATLAATAAGAVAQYRATKSAARDRKKAAMAQKERALRAQAREARTERADRLATMDDRARAARATEAKVGLARGSFGGRSFFS